MMSSSGMLLKHFISNFLKKLWSHFSPKRPGNYWSWHSDCTTCKSHRLVQWSNPWSCYLKSIYLPNLSGFARIMPFSTLENTWILIPAPAVRRFTSNKCNMILSTSSISNGWPLLLPTVDYTVVSPFFFFCSCMDFLWPFTHGRTAKFGNFGWNLSLLAALTPKNAAYFAISCFSFLAETVHFSFSSRVTFKLSWTFSSSFSVMLLDKSFFIFHFSSRTHSKDPKQKLFQIFWSALPAVCFLLFVKWRIFRNFQFFTLQWFQ